MIRKNNGFSEDLGAVIGFSNTLLICGTRGGKQLYVPEKFSQDHLLCRLLGETAFRALIEAWGGETLTIPNLSEFSRYQRIRTCASLLLKGRSMHSVARITGVTYNQVKNDRRTAELLGLLPKVFSGSVDSRIKSDEQVVQQLGFDGF